jgi:hypothetical protein
MIWCWWSQRYNRCVNEYSFEDLKEEILAKLNEFDKQGFFGKNKQLTVLDGFVYLTLQDKVGGGVQLGGRSLPVVVVYDNETGQVWQFSLKQLVPRVELK